MADSPTSSGGDDARGLPPELIRHYRLSCAEHALELRRCAETGDATAAARIAHQVAGTGTSYGFPELTESARSAEAHIAEHGLPTSLTALHELTARLEAVSRA